MTIATMDKPLEEMSKKELLALIEQQRTRPLTCKVSVKGAVSVYGLQRMPVTLYAGQWERLLGFGPEIKGFINENTDKLSRK